MTDFDVILASASPRRRELLEQAGVKFTVRVPVAPVDEKLSEEESADPYTAVKKLAEKKSGAVVQELLAENVARMTIVIGADTLVVKNNEIFGKPRSASDATHMLRRLSGCTHQVMTGVCVWAILPQADGNVSAGFRSWTDESQVTFKTLSDAEIADYLKQGESFDKAGAYAIQGEAKKFVVSVMGAMDTIIGLPVEKLLREFPELVEE